MKTLRIETDYAARRAAEYPPIGDQLDAIAKALERSGIREHLPAETRDWLDKIAAVKARFPKPSERSSNVQSEQEVKPA